MPESTPQTTPRRSWRPVAVVLVMALTLAVASSDYRVERGDTLTSIARQNGVSVTSLASLNGITNPNMIRIGQVLEIPGQTSAVSSTAAEHTVQPGDSIESIAARYGVSVDQILRANGITNPNVIYTGTRLRLSGDGTFIAEGAGETAAATHTVARGQTMSSIASQYRTTINAIADANGVTNPNLIFVGQKLVIPGGGWVCPVPGASFFNDWGFPRSGGRTHTGTDLFADRGAPILAPVSGVLTQQTGRIGGMQFTLVGDDGVTYFGSHMGGFGASGRVTAGTVIGYNGDSGNAIGSDPHLHFEIHPNGGGPVNPYPTLEKACG